MSYLTVAKARSLIQVDRNREALEMLQADPDSAEDPEAHVVIALAHLGLEQPKEALASGQTAIGMDPDLAMASYVIAESYNEMDRNRDYLKWARQAAALDPSDPWMRRSLANALVVNQRLAEAREQAQEGLRLAPGREFTWSMLARVELANENWDDAEKAARAALGIDPESIEAQSLLSLAEFSRGGKGREVALERMIGTLRDNPSSEAAQRVLTLIAVGNTHRISGWVMVLLVVLTQGLAIPVIMLAVLFTSVKRFYSLSPELRQIVMRDPDIRKQLRAIVIVVVIVCVIVAAAVVG